MARGFVFLSSIYLALVILVIVQPDDLAFESFTVPAYWVAAAVGLVYGSIRTPEWVRSLWLVAFTVACLGRGLTLMVYDVEYLTGPQQAAAAVSWILLWVGGTLATMVLTANEILRRH